MIVTCVDVSDVFPVNPPAPVPCPIGGRYSFIQEGESEALYITRIRGITERPRHLIDCMEFVSEFKSCDNNPKKIFVDAEYCATLDHTAKPIGEYGEWLIVSYVRGRHAKIFVWTRSAEVYS